MSDYSSVTAYIHGTSCFCRGLKSANNAELT